jgi:hypothetical protein
MPAAEAEGGYYCLQFIDLQLTESPTVRQEAAKM